MIHDLCYAEYRVHIRAWLGINGTKGNEVHWGGGISFINQNFTKSPSIFFNPLESSISQTSPYHFNYQETEHTKNREHVEAYMYLFNIRQWI
jgi:hypothetical protein